MDWPPWSRTRWPLYVREGAVIPVLTVANPDGATAEFRISRAEGAVSVTSALEGGWSHEVV